MNYKSFELWIGRAGHQTQAGTDWPIYVTIRRDGPREYRAYATCNGYEQWHEIHTTRREAIDTAAGWVSSHPHGSFSNEYEAYRLKGKNENASPLPA